MPDRYADYNKEFPLRPLGRDEDGHKRYGCRRCGKRLGKRLRSFCSEECRRDVLVRCGTEVRHYVGERDFGVCARCGLHVPFLVERIKRAAAILKGDYFKPESYPGADQLRPAYHWHASVYQPWYTWGGDNKKRDRFTKFLRAIGIEYTDLDGKSLWEAHHKVAVKDGGGKCGLDNYETLCRWCHRMESAAQHKKWARARKKDDGQTLLIGEDA
jgi:hypothetical protein